MCFTINIHTTRNAIEKRFSVNTSSLIDFEFRYFYRAFNNPMIPVISQSDPGNVQLMSWGLIPHWASDLKQAHKIRTGTYNARSETLLNKASFKDPFLHGRCWIISNGFYEWQHVGKEKIPWYISTREDNLFAFAGICDSWTNPNTGIEEKTCSIITTKANSLMEKIHNTKKRMPLILYDDNEKKWLKNTLAQEEADEIFLPHSDAKLNAYTIGKNISRTNTDPFDESVLDKIEYHVDGKLF